MSLDFAWDEEKKYETIPEGVYTCQINKASINETQEKPRLEWEFLIIDGQFERRKVWINQVITPKSVYFINRNLAPFGMSSKSPKDLPGLLEIIIGASCKINLTHSKYKSAANPDKVYYEAEIIESLKTDDNQIPF
jgi:hypothetical protein